MRKGSESPPLPAVLFGIFLLACAGFLQGQTPDRALAIVHATVIDTNGGPTLSGRTVLIAGDRITAVAPDGLVRFSASTPVLDATGKYLIPGLWDMHVHMRGAKNSSAPDLARANEDLLPLYLANGVTGVREMGGDLVDQVLRWRSQTPSGKTIGPRIITCGPKLDGPLPEWPGSIAISSAEQARSAVRHVKALGADFVKVYNEVPNIPADAWLALLDEARAEGMRVTGHVPLNLTVAELSDAGQDIEHYNEYLVGCIRKEKELKAAVLEYRIDATGFQNAVVQGYSREAAVALFSKFAVNHTWVTPTLIIAHELAGGRTDRRNPDPRVRYLPREWLDTWNDRSEDPDPLARRQYRQSLDSVKLMSLAGVSLLAGSDTGASNAGTFPGFSLHDELAQLVKAGLTPLQAIQCATRNPAVWMKQEARTGTVEPGKLADLVLLDGNPLKDIRSTRKIRAVIFNGRLFDRNQLDRMLSTAETRAKSQE